MFTSRAAISQGTRRDIPEGWYAIAPLKQIKLGQLNKFDLCGRALLVLQEENQHPKVFDRACPHMGIDLAKGHLCDGQIVCPYHDAPFSVESGNYTGDVFKTPMQMRTYPSTVCYGWLWFYSGSTPRYELPVFSEETHDFSYQKVTVKASMDNLMLNAIDGLHLVPLHKTLLTGKDRFYTVEPINEYAFRCYMDIDVPARGILNIESMGRLVYGPSLSINGVEIGGETLNYRILTFRPLANGKTQIVIITCMVKDRPKQRKIDPLLPPYLKFLLRLLPAPMISAAINTTLFLQDLIVTRNIISNRRTPDEFADQPAIYYLKMFNKLQK